MTADAGTGRIEYDRAKLLTRGAVSLALAAAGLWLLGRSDGLTMVGAAATAPATAAAALACFAKALGPRTALSWDARGVTLSTLFTRRTLAWSRIVHVGVRRRRMRLLYGLVPVPGGTFLSVQYGVGLRPPTVQLPVELLGLEGRPVQHWIDRLQAARREERPGEVSTKGGDAGFDPDAIMARYLAQRSQAAAPLDRPKAQRAQFGRKGAGSSA
jgi:hypothetical protein